MDVRMSYSVYKHGYTEFPADDYDAKTKTIHVRLPEYKKPKFPKDFGAGHPKQADNVIMFVYNSGYAENYYIEQLVHPYKKATIGCGLYAREEAIRIFNEMRNEVKEA